jgi:hypothetical protein
VTEFPSVAIETTTGERVLFEGKIGADSLVEFFDRYAAPAPERSATPEKEVRRLIKTHSINPLVLSTLLLHFHTQQTFIFF